MKNILLLLSVVLLISLAMTGCYYDKEDALYPPAPACDTVFVTYSGSVSPIMTASCNVCHNSVTASGGVVTDNYTSLAVIAKDGRLWGVVSYQSGFLQMPKDLPQLSACDLAKIKKWTDAGSPNN